MIQEAFVSFEIAKLLKEKGFDENTLMVYMSYGDLCKCNRYDSIRNSNYNDITKNYFECTAPTHQMAMKWLREVHGLFIMVDCGVGSYVWSIADMSNGNVILKIDAIVGSYEQAVESAIKYCLEKII